MPQPRILIADDEKDIRDLFVDSLQPHGFDVRAAKDGREAVDIIRNGHIDIAFLDIRMPGLNGVEALREISRTRPETQVVMITGYCDDDRVHEALGLGSFLCLMKPFKIQDVLGLIDVLKS